MTWLTIVTTLTAAIAPSIVSIVANIVQYKINKQNNEFQLKQKEIDTFYSHRNIAINNYLDSLSNYINISSKENLSAYQSTYCKVSIYVSQRVFDHINTINDCINKQHFEEIPSLLYILSDILNSESQTFYDCK